MIAVARSVSARGGSLASRRQLERVNEAEAAEMEQEEIRILAHLGFANPYLEAD